MKWEYYHCEIETDKTTLTAELNAFGQLGWELVTLERRTPNYAWIFIATFKRQLT